MDNYNKSLSDTLQLSFQNIEFEIDEILNIIDIELARLTKIKNALLQKRGNIDISLKLNNEVNRGYPIINGGRQDKILAVLKITSKVLRQKEIEDIIMDIEGSLGVKTLKSMYYTLNDKMFKQQGQLAFLRVADSYKYSFYALPEWLDDDQKLKKEYLPSNNVWRNFPEEKRKKIETEKWKLHTKNEILKKE